MVAVVTRETRPAVALVRADQVEADTIVAQGVVQGTLVNVILTGWSLKKILVSYLYDVKERKREGENRKERKP